MLKNKFKKIIIATGSLAMTSTMALAGSAPYVGAALGINTITSTTSGSSFRSAPLDLFAGFGGTVNSALYLGGEVTATPFTALLSNTGNSLKTTYSYGISFLPGVMFSDHTLGYVRAGVTRSHFSSIGQNKTGGQLGVGMQTDVMPELNLRTEYVYTSYSKVGTVRSPKSDAFKLGLIYKFE
jgi:opacity protein-like surface antigen